MQVFRKDGFRMSISDTARQLLLVAHGQWDPSDGNLKFPKDVRVIHFYTVHQEYGKIGAAYAVLDAPPAAAYRGLTDAVNGVTARSVVDLSGETQLANYDLGWHEDSPKLFEKHQAQTPKFWSPDVDLILFDNERGEAHLKQALRVAGEGAAWRGWPYQVIHCCHCRYVAPS
jgi:hypothetical protein